MLNELLQRENSPAKITSPPSVKLDDLLIEHRFIKLSYKSLVDWRTCTDYLRCSPSFFNKPRYDCVIVNNEPDFFARLVFVFTYTIKAGSEGVKETPDGKDYTIPVALVQPFEDVQPLRKRDKDLRLFRLQAQPRENSIFVPARSLRRGAFIVSEGLGRTHR